MSPITDHSVCYKIAWLEQFEVSATLHKHIGLGDRWALTCPQFGIYVFDLRTKDFVEAECRVARKLYRVALTRVQREAKILSELKNVIDSIDCEGESDGG